MWMEHFKSLYNSVDDDGSKDKLYAPVYSSNAGSSYKNNVSVHEICDAIFKQKRVKLLVQMVLLWKPLCIATIVSLFT